MAHSPLRQKKLLDRAKQLVEAMLVNEARLQPISIWLRPACDNVFSSIAAVSCKMTVYKTNSALRSLSSSA
jgi:hypothetical protein